MKVLDILLMFIIASSCSIDHGNLKIYVSNRGIEQNEKLLFDVIIDDSSFFSDTVENAYLSHYWEESNFSIVKGEHSLKFRVSGESFRIEKDTIINLLDSTSLFMEFSFYQKRKRYNNPELYRFFEGKIENFKRQADSLYANELVPNATDYLNDTIPLPEHLSIVIKQ